MLLALRYNKHKAAAATQFLSCLLMLGIALPSLYFVCTASAETSDDAPEDPPDPSTDPPPDPPLDPGFMTYLLDEDEDGA